MQDLEVRKMLKELRLEMEEWFKEMDKQVYGDDSQ